MDPNSPKFQKWLRSSLNEEFGVTVDKWLDKEPDGYKVSQKIISSKKMTKFMNSTKNSFLEQQAEPQNGPSLTRPQTSISFLEKDFFEDDWSFDKGNSGSFNDIIEDIGSDKPNHVRLAGYETLLKYDLGSLLSNDSWERFLSALRDAICDGSRPVFEASLQMHTKILGFPYPLHEKSNEVFLNLINAYEGLYQMRKFNEMMPTTISGINFKIMLHEKLCRIMHLLICHQEEVLKNARSVDRNTEEMIEHFLTFLSTNASSQSKSLNTLNIISILEPQANWSKKWNHSFLTRRIFCHTLSKVPNLLQRVFYYITKYLENPPTTIPVTIVDDIDEAYISGESIEALTYLHCLNFLAQLYGSSSGRSLLFEHLTDDCSWINEFLISMLNCLNVSIISEVSNGIYETMHQSLVYVIQKPIVLCDARFFSTALNPLMRESDHKIWPHVMDVLMYMLETEDGRNFLVTEYQTKSANAHKRDIKYPVESILYYASNLLKQPLCVMNIEHLRDLLKVIEKIFDINEIYDVVQKILQTQFFPALKYFYSNVDKYFVENENKTQKFNRAAKRILLVASLVPKVLRITVNEPSILRELVQDSIAPLRTYWDVNKVVAFISNAAFLSSGFEVVKDFAPHILSTFIIELCKQSEEQLLFYDPWTNINVTNFLHILSLFSLNTKCFMAFMTVDSDEDEKHDYPISLKELYQHCLNPESCYHYLSLLSLKSTIWNFDVFIYLLNSLNFQEEFLNMQKDCIIEIEEEEEIKEKYIIDECSLMRHIILVDTHKMETKDWDFEHNPENFTLFSKFESEDEPQTKKQTKSNPKTEFDELLEDDRPGLRDSSWVSEARRAFRNSENPIMNISVYNLLNQMQEAIPTVDWVLYLNWDTETDGLEDYWLPEEVVGFDVVINYAQINKLPLIEKESQYLLKKFMKSTYDYIKFDKSIEFAYFDWFLSSVFIICKGDLDKCKTFVSQFIKFPSAMFVWPILGIVVDRSNSEEFTTQTIFAQLLEDIVRNEFPSVLNALKHNCGSTWWMICNKLISQCFWGILPWSEILNFLAICILYPPDYILYYCASLLNYCQYNLLQNVTNYKLWPDNLNLRDYKYHNQISFIDQLGKRYRGKILPIMAQRKLKIAE